MSLSPETTRGQPLIETTPPDERPKRLFAIVIGISTYRDPAWKLDFADKDATSFKAALKAQQGRFFSEVNVKLLLNGDATKGNILDALDWLRQSTSGDDLTMIYFAGHGNDGPANSYYLLPWDYDANKTASTALFDSELLRAVGALRCRTLVFLDACRSRNVTASSANLGMLIARMAAPSPEGASSGVVVFCATGSEAARESRDWGGGHGAFTWALLQGLDGGAANRAHEVSFKRLDVYLSEQVPLLTGNQQTPTTAVIGVRDFPIALCAAS